MFYCFVLLCQMTAWTQPVSDDLPRVTECIALVNIKLVAAPGKSPMTQTVVLRDGLITHMGADIRIPPDAYIIQADSMYAYPAFIDAFSHTGIKEETTTPAQGGQGRSQRPPVDEEGNPSHEDAGITPFTSVRTSIDAKEKSIADWRAQGFAVAHVVPKGRMIPGKGSIIIMSGKNANELIWKENVSLYSQWNGAGGNYPTTVIAMMAKWRELYENTSLYLAHMAAYQNQNANLVSRPIFAQAHEALTPVVKKEMPVFFRAAKVKDISRALALQEDLGMKLVIADAEEAYFLKDHFAKKTTPLVLSLDLPEEKGDDKDEKDAPPASTPLPDSTKTIEGEKKKPNPEVEAFEKRRAESLMSHRAQAATFSNAGIPFSFGTMSVKPGDFSKNVQAMITQGLPAEAAPAALTTKPASLLGIEKQCGTLEVGKMANIIVSNKELFEKDYAIRYMVVEGSLYEYEAKEKKKPSEKVTEEVAAVIKGTWSFTIEAPDKKRSGTMEFTNEEGAISGSVEGEDFTPGGSSLDGIVIDGNSVSFTNVIDFEGQNLTLEFDINLRGESFDGNVTVGSFGSFPITGQRTAKPKF